MPIYPHPVMSVERLSTNHDEHKTFDNEHKICSAVMIYPLFIPFYCSKRTSNNTYALNSNVLTLCVGIFAYCKVGGIFRT